MTPKNATTKSVKKEQIVIRRDIHEKGNVKIPEIIDLVSDEEEEQAWVTSVIFNEMKLENGKERRNNDTIANIQATASMSSHSAARHGATTRSNKKKLRERVLGRNQLPGASSKTNNYQPSLDNRSIDSHRCLVPQRTQEGKLDVEMGTKKVQRKNRKIKTFLWSTHTGRRQYKCSHCNIKFASNSGRNSHVKKIHASENVQDRNTPSSSKKVPFQTASSNLISSTTKLSDKTKTTSFQPAKRSFRTRRSATLIKTMNCGEAPFTRVSDSFTALVEHKCDTCQKSFSTQGSLKNHEKLHSKVFPFECSICNKKFPRKDYFDYHLISLSHKQQLSATARKNLKMLQNLEPQRMTSVTSISRKLPTGETSTSSADLVSSGAPESANIHGCISLSTPPAPASSTVQVSKPPTPVSLTPSASSAVPSLTSLKLAPTSAFPVSPVVASSYAIQSQFTKTQNMFTAKPFLTSKYHPTPGAFVFGNNSFPVPTSHYTSPNMPLGFCLLSPILMLPNHPHFSNPFQLPVPLMPVRGHQHIYYSEACAVCGGRFEDKTKLRLHMQNVHPTKSFKCQICLKVALSPDDLIQCHQSHKNL